jgi:hypothetical protein
MFKEADGGTLVKHIVKKRMWDYLNLRLELRPSELAHICECEECFDGFNACAAAKHLEKVQARDQATSASKKAA